MPSIDVNNINSNKFTSLHLHAENKGEYQCYRHESNLKYQKET